MTRATDEEALAPYVRILGRGPGRSRNLTFDEAFEAMQLILSGRAAPEALGALLMLMRFRGETGDEIAGFATALREHQPQITGVDLDWPAYAAGRSRGEPWFLLSAKLLSQAGHSVLLHGWNGHDTSIQQGVAALGIPQAKSLREAEALLQKEKIAYLPLEVLCPTTLELLLLRKRFGLRSCINTVARMVNPGRAKAAVQGVFHPAYRHVQQEAAAKLGLERLTVIKGGGGEVERLPNKACQAFGIRDGQPWEALYPPLEKGAVRLIEIGDGITACDLWHGKAHDPMALATVLGTAALALDTLGVAEDIEQAQEMAQSHWNDRP